jgi:hypothetical protein
MIFKHYNFRGIIRFIAVCYCLELLYKLNEYSYSSEESPDSLNQESEFLTSTKNLTLKTKKSTNLRKCRFFVYQAFNMNPINFLDPMGEEYYVFSKDRKSVSVYLNKQQYLDELEYKEMWAVDRMGNGNPALHKNSAIKDLPSEYQNEINNAKLADLSNKSGKAISFVDRDGGTTSDGFNAIAHLTESYGNGHIDHNGIYDARTIPSGPNFATIQNGVYRGVSETKNKKKKNKYPAIGVRRLGGSNRNRVLYN